MRGCFIFEVGVIIRIAVLFLLEVGEVVIVFNVAERELTSREFNERYSERPYIRFYRVLRALDTLRLWWYD